MHLHKQPAGCTRRSCPTDLSYDANGKPINLPDGKQNTDAGGNYLEPGVPGVIVTLYNADTNAVVKTTTTDANGFYRFDDLMPGRYYVVFQLPANVTGIWTFANADGVPDDANSDAATPANPDDTARQTGVYTLTAGEINLTVDAALISLSGLNSSALGDRVWIDANQNGLQDGRELNFATPLTVNLYLCSDNSLLNT